jgi:hypothetical protein
MFYLFVLLSSVSPPPHAQSEDGENFRWFRSFSRQESFMSQAAESLGVSRQQSVVVGHQGGRMGVGQRRCQSVGGSMRAHGEAGGFLGGGFAYDNQQVGCGSGGMHVVKGPITRALKSGF